MTKNERWLYLDDIRTPIDKKWEIARNYNEFVMMIELNGLDAYSVISLDHDLGEQSMIEYYTNVKNQYKLEYENLRGEKTGYDCAKFLVAQSIKTKIPLPNVYTHSANPIGAANIIGYINNYYKNSGMKQSCVSVEIAHKIDQSLAMTPEQRKSKWDKTNLLSTNAK